MAWLLTNIWKLAENKLNLVNTEMRLVRHCQLSGRLYHEKQVFLAVARKSPGTIHLLVLPQQTVEFEDFTLDS